MEFKISCLLFIRNHAEKILLLKRKKSPNQGLWSPPGGKIEDEIGESPYECASTGSKRRNWYEPGIMTIYLFLAMFLKRDMKIRVIG